MWHPSIRCESCQPLRSPLFPVFVEDVFDDFVARRIRRLEEEVVDRPPDAVLHWNRDGNELEPGDFPQALSVSLRQDFIAGYLLVPAEEIAGVVVHDVAPGLVAPEAVHASDLNRVHATWVVAQETHCHLRPE